MRRVILALIATLLLTSAADCGNGNSSPQRCENGTTKEFADGDVGICVDGEWEEYRPPTEKPDIEV